jgi:hypothetical protein
VATKKNYDMNTLERNEIFDLAYRFVTETNENIFLTGNAGTGKTTFLKYLKENCAKNMVVAAPTGVAAINAGGVTLHSLFQLPFHPFLPTSFNRDELLGRMKFNKQRQQLLRKMELLVIDEISMVRCDTMDAIDTILKSVRRRHDLPFGGVQMLFIGDLFQLPPVAKHDEWRLLQEYYASPFFFDSSVISQQLPLLIELTTIYRQKENSFVRLLNKVRNNNMDADDFEDLHMRYKPDFRPSFDENYITLTSHNNQADQINHREIQKIASAPVIYEAIIEDDFPENSYPAEGSLVLKTGAQVMFLKNDVISKRYFNGKIGIVKSLTLDEIIVDCDGDEINVAQETWENSRYSLDREGKLDQETLGTFTQFPLRLAWAITIHKSQGLTFEKVMIDAGSAFSSGQVYVALSRCTSLDGIVLLTKIPSAAIYSNESVTKGQQSLSPKGSLADRFAGARQIYTQQILEDIFSFDDLNVLADQLNVEVNKNADKLNKAAVEWTNGLKQLVNAENLIGRKFISQVSSLMRNNSVVEENAELLNRIQAAANHFEPKFTAMQQKIYNHPIITEHREAALIINELLTNLYQVNFISQYYLQHCKQPFSLTSFLQHKIKYTQPKTSLTCYASGKKQSYSDIPNEELFQTLKRWRDMTCEHNNLPIYMLANHATLTEIATFLPFTKKDLLKIGGFGKVKVDKYGHEIIDMVEEYCTRNHVESNMHAKGDNPKRVRGERSLTTKTPTIEISYNLFKKGKSIPEIAVERKMTIGTIEGHLALFVVNGEIDINDIIPRERQLLILEAARIHKEAGFKTIKDHLPEEVTYGEIRLVLALEKK